MELKKENDLNNHFSILIAEDNPVSLKMLEKVLCKGGYQVTPVDNGRKAIEELNKNFYPIVIADWMMPEVDGLELCRLIRSKKLSRYIYIILLTAKDSKDDIVCGLNAGADDYLTKPFNKAELFARINTGKRIIDLESSLIKASEQIKKLSVTDMLTKSYNRLYITTVLPKEIKRAKRYHRSLSLIFCDIDHFKKINDTYGHVAGDCVLKEFVACIIRIIRKDIDWVSRYGGEEFLIVLPETELEGAYIVAEKLRNTVSQMIIRVDKHNIKLTASFGVMPCDKIYMPDKKISAESLINEADKFLYQAKQEGRNRVKGPDISSSFEVNAKYEKTVNC